MSETYEPGELFVYMNGDHWELGEVKSANNTGTGYFCWYSTGDTAANTPTSHMHKLANAGWSHIERGECERILFKPTNVLVCSECGCGLPKQLDKYCYLHYCPHCGRRIKR